MDFISHSLKKIKPSPTMLLQLKQENLEQLVKK